MAEKIFGRLGGDWRRLQKENHDSTKIRQRCFTRALGGGRHHQSPGENHAKGRKAIRVSRGGMIATGAANTLRKGPTKTAKKEGKAEKVTSNGKYQKRIKTADPGNLGNWVFEGDSVAEGGRNT